MNIVQQIHTDFDSQIDLLLSRIENNHPIVDIAPDISPISLHGKIGKIQRRYPFYKIITKQQIKALCLKYDLYFGPLLGFGDEIPDRNKKQISDFAYHADDSCVNILELNTDYLYNVVRADVPIGIEWNSLSYGEARFFISFSYNGHPEMMGKKSIVGMGEGMGISIESVENPNYRTDGYEVCGMGCHLVEPQYRNVFSWLVPTDFGLARARSIGGQFIQQASFEFGMYQGGTSYDLEFEGNKILSKRDLCPMVVAPKKMFLTSFEVIDDWELVLSRNPDPKIAPFVDDPIVLRPLGGDMFLINTKWGGEAMLPEVQNETLN